MTSHKVIVDTCVLIAASINHSCVYITGEDIREKFFFISKRLFEHFKNNLDRKHGIILNETITTSREKIADIIDEHMQDINKRRNIDMKIYMDEYALALAKIEDCLNECIRFIDVIDINKLEIEDIKERVKKFFNSVPKLLEKHHPRKSIRKRISRAFGFKFLENKLAKIDEKTNFIIIEKLFNKFKRKYSPDDEDINILSYATYLRKQQPEQYEVYVASTDHHFSKINIEGSLSTFIPDEIEKRFHVKCDWPDTIVSELIKNI